MRNVYPGKEIHCEYGVTIKLTGDDPRKIQEEFDRLVDAFQKLVK